MENISAMLRGGSPDEYQHPEPAAERDAVRAPGEQPWEMIMDKKHFKLWRRPIEGTHLYQYRGTAPAAAPAWGFFPTSGTACASCVLPGLWRKKCEIPSCASPSVGPIPSQPFGRVPAPTPASVQRDEKGRLVSGV